MLHRHVALGNRQQAGQSRFRCQQVVEAGIELLFGHPVADVEQVPLAVVQEAEVGLPGELLAALGEGAQAGRDGGVRRALGQFQARLCGRQQMAAEVAAVHGGHIHRQQRRQRLRVVPVQKMPTMALHPLQRGERGFHPCQQLGGVDPAELARASRAQQVQTNVGRRGAVRHHVHRQRLQVVRRQVVVIGHHAALEQAPGVARDAFKIGAIGLGQHQLGVGRAWPADAPGPQGRRGPPQAQHRRQPRRRGADGEQHGQQCQRQQRLVPVLPPQRRQRRLRTRLRRRRGGPLQQVAVADRQAVERAHDRIGHQQCLRHQLRQQPGAAHQRAPQIGSGQAVEMAQGDVVAAWRKARHRAHQRPGRKSGCHLGQCDPR